MICTRCKEDKNSEMFYLIKTTGKHCNACNKCRDQMKKNNTVGIFHAKKCEQRLLLEKFFNEHKGEYTTKEIKKHIDINNNAHSILQSMIKANIINRVNNNSERHVYTAIDSDEYNDKRIVDLKKSVRSKKVKNDKLDDFNVGDFDPYIEIKRRVKRWMDDGMSKEEMATKMRDYRW